MRSRLKTYAAALLLTFGLAACASAPPTTYSWGNYSHDLLNYYKKPDELQKFSDGLKKDIDTAEADERPAPPGLYAEYGYTLLELGDADGAIVWFAKEEDTWPESVALMKSVIARLSNGDQDKDTGTTSGNSSGTPDAGGTSGEE